MRGLAQLFRILRNTGSADFPHRLSPAATQDGFVAAVENTAPSPTALIELAVLPPGQQQGWQWGRSLVSRSGCAVRWASAKAVIGQFRIPEGLRRQSDRA